MKQEAKLVYLLECLQKTAPPVLVFAEKTADVDDIHEYLLVKGVEAVAVHGGKDQEEREAAIDEFKVPSSPGTVEDVLTCLLSVAVEAHTLHASDCDLSELASGCSSCIALHVLCKVTALRQSGPMHQDVLYAAIDMACARVMAGRQEGCSGGDGRGQ